MDRPILFNDPMAAAIQAGLKTHTLRPLKNPEHYGCPTGDCLHVLQSECDAYMASLATECPYGQPGDRLWVRETWCPTWHGSYEPMPRSHKVRSEFETCIQYRAPYFGSSDYDGHWRPSIHMPRWASRTTLRIISVRLLRVQELSEADALREGCKVYKRSGRADCYVFEGTGYDRSGLCHSTARTALGILWDSIYGDHSPTSWGANPWAWAIGFEVVR